MPTVMQILRHMVNQNDLILRHIGMVLDMQGLTLERTFEMADDLDTVVADVAASTDLQESTAIVVDHAVSLLDDIGQKLKEAGTDPAKLRALHESITSNSQRLEAKKGELSEAVTRNTPFDPSAQ